MRNLTTARLQSVYATQNWKRFGNWLWIRPACKMITAKLPQKEDSCLLTISVPLLISTCLGFLNVHVSPHSPPPPSFFFFVHVLSSRVHSPQLILDNHETSNSSSNGSVHVPCMYSSLGLDLIQLRSSIKTPCIICRPTCPLCQVVAFYSSSYTHCF